MNAPDSNHEAPVDGLDVHGAPSYSVQPTPTAPNQQLQLVPHGNRSSGSANVTELGVSGIDGLRVSGDGFYSSSLDVGRVVGMIGSTVCSSPKPSKKRSSCYNRRSDVKKDRLIWTAKLHRHFLESYNRLPEDKRVPKKITEDMRKAGFDVSRENVASHLQKHRLNLKGKENKKKNSGKPSSTSVPPKEEINCNFQKFHTGTSNSTYPNAVQIFHQSHFISTNPDFQSHSLSTNPNSYIPLQSPSFSNSLNSQSHSLSNIPNSHLPIQSPSISTNRYSHLPLQSPSFSNSPRSQSHSFSNSPSSQSHSFSTIPNSQLPLNEPMVNQLLSPFDQTHISDPNTLQSSSLYAYNDLSIHGEANNSDFPFGVTGQSSNAASNSDFFVMADHFLPPIGTNYQLVSNFDGFGNAIHPTLASSRFGDLSGNDYSLGALPKFYDLSGNVQVDGLNNLSWGHNVQVDDLNNWSKNVQVDGLNNMNMNLQFNFPLNSNVPNDVQVNDSKQGLQSKLGPPGDNQVDNKRR